MPSVKGIRWLAALPILLLGARVALGEDVNPLKPVDRSSPRAAIQTLLDSGDKVGEFLVREYVPSPSRSGYERLIALARNVNQGLDLSEVPPAARPKAARAASTALYEI